ncbi:MAG: hypothetical protein U5M50_03975 [Sphingobium sp.]|nr:hypothetical protein [Sphingobium sp.]
MKSIELYGAALDNIGVRREAGEIVAVGTEDEFIDPARAAELIAIGTAVEVKPVEVKPARVGGEK